MNKLALLAASIAVLGFTAPSFASDNSAAQGRVQMAQAGVSVSIGDGSRARSDGPRVRSRVVVREDRGRHHGMRHHHRHNARAERVMIVKKRAPAPTVIIDRR